MDARSSWVPLIEKQMRVVGGRLYTPVPPSISMLTVFTVRQKKSYTHNETIGKKKKGMYIIPVER
jgi:hypothetical protein